MSLRLAFFSTVAIALAGCGPAPHVTDCNVTKTPFSQMKTGVFKTSCVFSSCHDKDSHMNNLDLETDPYTALMGMGTPPPLVDPDNAKAKSMGWKRAKPNDENNSFVWQKLNISPDQDPKTGLGARMPNTGQELDPEPKDEILCWIRRGAPND